MKPAAQLTSSSQLDVQALVQAQAYKIKRFFDCCSLLLCHTYSAAISVSNSLGLQQQKVGASSPDQRAHQAQYLTCSSMI